MGLRIRREVRVTGIKSEAAQRNILCAALFVAGSLSSRPSKAYAQLLQVNFATFNIGPVINLASKGNPGFPKFEGIFVVFSSYDTIFESSITTQATRTIFQFCGINLSRNTIIVFNGNYNTTRFQVSII